MKTIASLLLTSLLAMNAFAQGTINFANNSSTRLTFLNGAPLPNSSGFRVQLYYLPDQPTAPTREQFGQWTVLGASVHINHPTEPGVFSGATRTTPSTTAPGGAAWFLVRVWESALGADYFSAIVHPSALVGQSVVTRIVTGGDGSPPRPSTSLLAGTPAFQGFAVYPYSMPEPASVTLIGLATVALLAYRFRKKH